MSMTKWRGQWDTKGSSLFHVAQWLDCCLSGVQTKEKDGVILRKLIKRVDKFHMFGRGKGHAEYKGYTDEKDLDSFTTSIYSTTRFASSSFDTLQKVYSNYEGLIGAYSRMRETADEQEERRYMIKGRDGHDGTGSGNAPVYLVCNEILAQNKKSPHECKGGNQRASRIH